MPAQELSDLSEPVSSAIRWRRSPLPPGAVVRMGWAMGTKLLLMFPVQLRPCAQPSLLSCFLKPDFQLC